jgi:2,4-dienoyl-CoA reductase-like NADH-dependent reductase (Old Yellow Enzyme family)
VFSKTLAPSAIPLNLGDNWIACFARSLVFGTPQAMTGDQIDGVISQFTRAAKLASKAGFDGVEIHAARERNILPSKK